MTDRLIKILQAGEAQNEAGVNVLVVGNDADVADLSLDGVDRVELNFPKFSDGRAYSQAYLLRRRRKFAGDIRATGDVLAFLQHGAGEARALHLHQLVDQHVADAQRQFDRYPEYYQGDVVEQKPHFSRT